MICLQNQPSVPCSEQQQRQQYEEVIERRLPIDETVLIITQRRRRIQNNRYWRNRSEGGMSHKIRMTSKTILLPSSTSSFATNIIITTTTTTNITTNNMTTTTKNVAPSHTKTNTKQATNVYTKSSLNNTGMKTVSAYNNNSGIYNNRRRYRINNYWMKRLQQLLFVSMLLLLYRDRIVVVHGFVGLSIPSSATTTKVLYHRYYSPLSPSTFVHKKQQHHHPNYYHQHEISASSSLSSICLFKKSTETVPFRTSLSFMKCAIKNPYQRVNNHRQLMSIHSSFIHKHQLQKQQQQFHCRDRTILFMTKATNDKDDDDDGDKLNNETNNDDEIINGAIHNEVKKSSSSKNSKGKRVSKKTSSIETKVTTKVTNEIRAVGSDNKKRKAKKSKTTVTKKSAVPRGDNPNSVITPSETHQIGTTTHDIRTKNDYSKQQLDDENIDDEEYYYNAVEIPGNEEYDTPSNMDDIIGMTVAQLQQQLRLRGLKVTGKKEELIQRLLSKRNIDTIDTSDTTTIDSKGTTDTSNNSKSNNKYEPIDVTAYIDEDDKDKDVKSAYTASVGTTDDNSDEEVNPVSKDPEVWGSEARVVTDYNGQQLVIDNLSRTKIEFIGSNQSTVEAYVVASRDALKPYMAGGSRNNRMRNQTSTSSTRNSGDQYESVISPKAIVQNSERIVQTIQKQREDADSKRPIRFEDTNEVIDEGDENRILTDVVLNRDYSDWGKYSVTGEQISASEVAGVILLSDIYGAFNDDTKTLAEKIAFECQPIVVMVPDLFNGIPWQPTKGSKGTTEVNEYGQIVEEWRASVHDDTRVSVTIRAAAACLRERYGVTSILVFGTCYGGGRALEVAANYIPSIYDIDTISIGPPLVYPTAVIAWYPTRYHNVANLFGPKRTTTITSDPELRDHKVAVLCLFAENDTIPGATKADAVQLKSLLEQDDRIKDYMVKVFPNQDHGFAHIGISRQHNPQLTSSTSSFDREDDNLNFLDNEFGGSGKLNLYEGDAEVACLLSTAFMETYSRVFLPTIGPPVSLDTEATDWNTDTIEMTYDYIAASKQRDIRKEIDDAVANYVDPPFESGRMIDPTDASQEEELMKLLRSMESPEQANGGKYKILEDDDLPTIYAKLTAADNDFQIF